MLLAAAFFVSCLAKAQFYGADFVYGVKGGWNVTNISHADAKNKMSVHLGAFAEWRINDYFGIQPELLYSRQGCRDKYEVAGKKVKTQLRVNYLNIPVLAKLYVLEGLSVDLGPQLGFALNAKSKVKHGGHVEKDKIEHFNTCDFSFAIGASYALDDLIFSARYNIGLTNVFGKWEKNNKNHVFQVSLGYCLSNLF
ncbi:MAG: PorT family protein [Odoribacter sp.]|nr:PorT family protein [Odoribacter sp.]